MAMAMITTTMLMSALMSGGALIATATAASTDAGPSLAEAWFHVFGRSHVLLVHFPIGLIVVAALYEIIAAITGGSRRAESDGHGSSPSRIALWIVLAGALAAGATAWSGWTYANYDLAGDTSETLTWHRWTGVAASITAGVCLLVGILAATKHQRRLTNLYRVFLVAGAILVGFTGHYGGVMVHGADHLFGPLRGPTSTTPTPPPAPIEIDQQSQVAMVTYIHDLRPLLEARCFKCHGPRRQRSDLRLDTRSGIFAVHDDLVIVTPNDPDHSEMVRRTSLPAEHDDRMPPDDPPLTEEQILLIRAWVEGGAVWGDEVVADGASTTDDPRAAAAHEPAVMRTAVTIPELTDQQRAARDAALSALIERGVIAQPIAADTDAVEVRFSLLGDQITDADLELLKGLETSLAWLDLSGTAITDEGVKTLAGFEQLRRVALHNTALTDAGLAGLVALPHLEVLIAHSTQVTDAGIQTLRPVETLQRLYVWQTQVTKTGAAQLRAGRPTITVDLGE